MNEENWIKWSRELFSIAQTGITYAKSKYEEERFRRVYEIAGEIIKIESNILPKNANELYIQKGYATPQITTRGIIKRGNSILLVHEIGKKWNLPGGYADINDTPTQAVIREVFEETGYYVQVKGIVAIYSILHNMVFPQYAMYFLCTVDESKKVLPLSNETDIAQFVNINEIISYDLNQHLKDHWLRLKQLIMEENLCKEVD